MATASDTGNPPWGAATQPRQFAVIIAVRVGD